MKASSRRNRKSFILIIAILAAASGIAALLFLRAARAEVPEQKEEVRLIETDSLRYEPYTLQVEGRGFVRSSRSLTVAAQTGGRVIESYEGLRSGTTVTRGELLVRLEDELAANSLSLARVELIQATASLLSALKSEETAEIYARWSRYLGALNTEAALIPPLPRVRSEREKLLTSTYGVLSAYYLVRERENLLSYHRVTAPFDGSLAGDGVQQFGSVSAGAPLFTLTDTVHLEVSLPLTREELLQLDLEDGEVQVYPSGRRDLFLPGRLVRRDAVMDQDSQTVRVHVRFDNPEGHPLFLPGSYVEVLLAGETLPRAYTLSRALLNADQTINVYREGKLALLPVEIAAKQQDELILAPTLPEGTEIVLTRLQKPFPGMPLKKAGEPEDKPVSVDGEEE